MEQSMVDLNQESEDRRLKIRHSYWELADVDLELFDFWFNAQMRDRNLYLNFRPIYVLRAAERPSKFECSYHLDTGSDDDADVISFDVIQVSKSKVFIRLFESDGVLASWLQEFFGTKPMIPEYGQRLIDNTDVADASVRTKVGNPGIQAHRRAIERIRAGESEKIVKVQWRLDYKSETGILPDETGSGERDLWQKGVKRKLRDKTDRH